MIFRTFFIVRFFISNSYYKTARSAGICKLYGEFCDYTFAIRCLFNQDPKTFVFSFWIFAVLFYSYCIRIFERVFITDRNKFPKAREDQKDFNSYINSIWCIVITMFTVGYGDFYPKSSFGRLVATLSIITGVLIVSLITVGFFQNLNLSSSENKVLILLERISLREEFNQISRNIIKKVTLEWVLQNKRKKREEKLLLGNENNKENILLKDEEYKTLASRILLNSLDISHSIRDKNKIGK